MKMLKKNFGVFFQTLNSIFSRTVNIKKIVNLTVNTKKNGQITLNTKSHSDPLLYLYFDHSDPDCPKYSSVLKLKLYCRSNGKLLSG